MFCAFSWILRFSDHILTLTHPIISLVIDQLRQTGEFEEVRMEDDEAEHSLEMQLPYVRKVFEG